MNIGIVLAAGKGKRFGATDYSKTTVPLLGKPIVVYGVELFDRTCDEVLVVTGVFSESVEKIVRPLGVRIVEDDIPMGTGGSFAAAVNELATRDVLPQIVVVGYGDHMMFYHDETVKQLIAEVENGAAVSMVAAVHTNPNSLAWGRVVRNEEGDVLKIVEQKDATDEVKKIEELNAGLYAFDWKFAQEAILALKPSSVSGEYYLTDLIGIAVGDGKKVAAVVVPFEEVGYGINTPEELVSAEQLYAKRK